MLVVPSPKSHSTNVTSPRELSLNWIIRGARPDSTSTENDAEGGSAVGVGNAVVGAGMVVAAGTDGPLDGVVVGEPPDLPVPAPALSPESCPPQARAITANIVAMNITTL